MSCWVPAADRCTNRSVAKPAVQYLCFDLGGTKLFAALITDQGKIVNHTVKRIDQSRGLEGLLADFKELGTSLGGKYKAVSVASAGPLHSGRGVLLDPTNFFTGGKSWGVVPLVARLKKIFKKPVFLENDAAAAVMAESWKGGHGKSGRNIVAITLGTGVGIGCVANGQIVRAGQGLHPEASHIPINNEAREYPCGCGAYGCIEAYLAGTHFARRLSKRLGRELDGNQSLILAKENEPTAIAAFAEYGRKLAEALRSLAVVFAPEIVVLSGGFTKAAPFFLPATEAHLPKVMERYREGVDLLPKVRVSKLGDRAGVLGAAYAAIHYQL